MAPRAEHVALLFDPDTVHRVPEGLGSTLASHLLGKTVSRGDRVALPGWPLLMVEDVDPNPSTIRPGTDVTLHVPPTTRQGPLCLVIVVDASLTMGKGEPAPYEQAASFVDTLLLNARSFTQGVGMIVQGGQTRAVEPLKSPDDASGASILKVKPRGTFALEEGIKKGLKELENAGEGPLAVIAITDDGDAVDDALDLARPALHAGAALFIKAPNPSEAMQEGCRLTGGGAFEEARDVFKALASLVGTDARWETSDATSFAPGEDGTSEFEVVIEAIEGS